MTWDHTENVLWATTPRLGGASWLVRINVETGVGTSVGPANNGGGSVTHMSNIAAHPTTGDLYAWFQGLCFECPGNDLVTVNKATGTATVRCKQPALSVWLATCLRALSRKSTANEPSFIS